MLGCNFFDLFGQLSGVWSIPSESNLFDRKIYLSLHDASHHDGEQNTVWLHENNHRKIVVSLYYALVNASGKVKKTFKKHFIL